MRFFFAKLRTRAPIALTSALACTPATNEPTATADATADATAATTTAATTSQTTAASTSSATTQPTTDPGTTTGSSSSSSSNTGGGAPSFTEVYETVLVPMGCVAGYCHGGMAGGLLMTDEATAYANLVDLPATTPVCGLSVRVVPGAPDDSIFWRRVRPSALDNGDMCAPKMPQASMGLADPEAQLVYDWIAAGALE